MKKCAICGKLVFTVTEDLCTSCHKKYKEQAWTKELVKIEKHNYYMERKHEETSFSDLTQKEKEKLGLD